MKKSKSTYVSKRTGKTYYTKSSRISTKKLTYEETQLINRAMNIMHMHLQLDYSLFKDARKEDIKYEMLDLRSLLNLFSQPTLSVIVKVKK